jgi:hypothetical protein
MKAPRLIQEQASSLVVTVGVVATILVLLGSAVAYTQHISRMADRSRNSAVALEIADGHLEYLFTHWRNIYRQNKQEARLATNYFFTDAYQPGPLVSGGNPGRPPIIPLPSPSEFSGQPSGYSVTQYRVQSVHPMIGLDANENSTVGTSSQAAQAYGPNSEQVSMFYLAAVDVTVPSMTGPVTAKVRRVFERKNDNPWSFGLFYHDDLEIHPSTPITIDGAIHTNNNLYIGTSHLSTTGAVSHAGGYVNGWSPNDTSTRSGAPSEPSFAKSSSSLADSDSPPAQDAPYLPFGWNLQLQETGGSANNQSYRELVERPVPITLAKGSDPLGAIRYYYQPGYRIVINEGTNAVDISRIDNTGAVTAVTGSLYTSLVGNNGQGSSTSVLQQGQGMFDRRENSAISVTNVDIARLITNLGNMTGWTGVLYISDATVGTNRSVSINNVSSNTTKRAIRLINATSLPLPSSPSDTVKPGLTLVSDNPVYIQGNFNTGGNPPSNSGTFTSPTVGGYVRRQAAVIADSITVLSTGWLDSQSSAAITSRVASANITINAALVTGNVPSADGSYSGGAENHIRLLEDWSTRTFTYYGSMVQLYTSAQATAKWSSATNAYVAPATSRYYWDPDFGKTYLSANATARFYGSPPGTLTLASYLQQQRWYQVY